MADYRVAYWRTPTAISSDTEPAVTLDTFALFFGGVVTQARRIPRRVGTRTARCSFLGTTA
jgi:hypothetical protein